MNIAYIQSMPTTNGGQGGQVHVSQLADKLFKQGHQLYTNLASEQDERFIKLDTVKKLFAKGHEIDLFYIRIHGSKYNDELTLLREANLDAPCIWELNAPLEELRLKGISEHRLLRYNHRRHNLAKLVDGAICVTKAMENYAQNELGVKKTIVIPNGSDPELFAPSKKQEDLLNNKFIVLWSGSPQYEWQGLKIVEEVARQILTIDPDIIFIVTAEGVTIDNLVRIGKIPYHQMPAYIASADLGLCVYDLAVYDKINFQSHFYGSPLKLFDYMSCGIPIIGTNAGQIIDVLNETSCGLLTDNSISDIVAKILYIKNNPEMAKTMGQKGSEGTKNKYNWENIAKQSMEFCADIRQSFINPNRRPYHETILKKLQWRVKHELRYWAWPLIKQFIAH